MTEQTATEVQANIRVIFIDLDNTLLNSKHEMSDRNRDAIKRAVAEDVQVVLATGKTRASARAIIEALGLQTPGIYVQGLLTYNADGSIRQQQTLDPKIIRRIVTFVEDRGFAVLAYSGDRLLVKAPHPMADRINEYGEPKAEIVGPLVNQLMNTPIHKLIIFGEDKRLTALRWQLTQQHEGHIHLTTAKVLGTLEVLPAGASKGKAAKKLLKDMVLKPENMMAIGDGENDLELLQMAGLSVAVANADERLKAVAQHVVGSNDDDGVAEAIERFVAPPPAPPAPEPQPEDSETPSAAEAEAADSTDQQETAVSAETPQPTENKEN